MTITGKVVYQDLATGFWGIVADDGSEWRPLEMPKELQHKGLRVKVEAEKAEEGFSIFMWGTAIRIKSHQKI